MKTSRFLTAVCGFSLLAGLPGLAQKNITVFEDGLDLVAGGGTAPVHGMNIQSTKFRYDSVADVLDIRVSFDGVAGDVDGDGNPNAGTNDVANFGAGETLGITVDSDCDGSPDLIIGVPYSAALGGALQVREYAQAALLGDSFGAGTISGVSAVLVGVPSSASPDAVIRVSGWSQIGPNHQQFRGTLFIDSQADTAVQDTLSQSVNLRFSGTAIARERDPKNDVGIHPQSSNPTTGWDLTTTDFAYNPGTDRMTITQKFNGIAGDADGDGDPATWSLPTLNGDIANLGGSESIAIALDFDQDGTFDIVTGVPSGSAIDPSDLSVPIADFSGSISNLGTSFGSPTDTDATATLAHNPSAAAPDFVIHIDNWSDLTISPFQFGYRAFAGSFADGGFGEDNQVNSCVALNVQINNRFVRYTDALDVGVPPGHPNISGWDFTALEFTYDPVGDKLTILIDYHGIAGDADGDGDPGVSTASSGGTDSPDLGSGETITVALDLDEDGVEDTVIGVPTNKSLDVDTLELDIAEFLQGPALGQNYGAPDTSGARAFAAANPSAENPDFKITVFGWSLLDTQNPQLFGLRVFSGSTGDVCCGEDNIPNPNTPPLETKLNFPIDPIAFELDGTTGRTVVCFTGNEAENYEVVALGDDPGNTTGVPVTGLVDLLDGKVGNSAEIATDIAGFAEVEFNTPVSTQRGFFQIREKP